jgi:hypothetical protein
MYNSSKEYVQMAHIQSGITIGVSKDKVWKILADLGNIVKFHPFVTKSHYTSDQTEDVGATRYCHILPNMELSEEVFDWKPGSSYSVKVEMSGKDLPPVSNMVATLVVKENGGGAHASMSMDYDFIGEDAMAKDIQGQFQMIVDGVMQGLKHHAETGEEVDLGLLKRLKKAS